MFIKVNSLMKQARREEGFTLIELMVVIVILGILAALVLPRVVGNVGDDARATANEANIQMLQSAVDRYVADTGEEPTATSDLVTRPSGVPEEDWNGPYINEWPDPPEGFTAYTLNGGEVEGGDPGDPE